MNIDNKNIRKTFIRFLYFVKGKNTFNYLGELERSQWLSSNELRTLYWKKQKHLLNYVYRFVPYYKKVFKDLEITPADFKTPEDLRKLPILTKEDIEKNMSDITSIEYSDKDLIENSTGGSTGRNLRFYIDFKRLDYRECVAIRGNKWAGLDIGVKHAYLWGSPFDISMQNKIKNRIYNKILGCDLFLSSYDLSEQNMHIYVNKLKRYKPKVIVGYPSPLYLFAKFIDENNIRIPATKSIISSAEVLYDHQKKLIESVFQCEVYNRYGCREFGGIAHECFEHYGMHINAEHVHVECINVDGEPTGPEEKGELIVTDLDNYAMPFIRYKIEDIGMLSDRKCNCGRGLPILENIEGRTFDIIVGTNGHCLGGTFWTILLRTAVNGIQQFQVVQISENKIDIKIIIDDSFKKKDIPVLINKIQKYCGDDMDINVKIVEKIPLTKSGKHRFVISNVSPFEKRHG